MNFWEDCNNLDMWRRQVIKTLPTLAEDSSKLHYNRISTCAIPRTIPGTQELVMVKFRPTVRNVFILISLENFVPYDRGVKSP